MALDFDGDLDTLVSLQQQSLKALQQIAAAIAGGAQPQKNAAQLYSTTPTSGTSGTTSSGTSPGTAVSESLTVNTITPQQLVNALRMHTRGNVKEDNWQVATLAGAGQASFQVRNNGGQGITILPSALATYQNAEVIFYSGNNQGVRSTVANITSSGGQTTIFLKDNLPSIANVGDEFIVLRPTGTLIDLVGFETISNQAAGENFAAFIAPGPGLATIQIGLATASVVNLSITTYSGGTPAILAINNGASLPAGEWQGFQFAMSSGASYALQVATAQTGTLAVSIEGKM